MWECFWQLDRARGSNGFGPLPVGYVEIEAWCRLRGTPLWPWELDALARMDDERLRLMLADDDAPKGRPLTPELFDALFIPQ